MTRQGRQHFKTEVSHINCMCYLVCLSGTVFRYRMDEEHHQLGEDYHQLSTPTARKNFIKEYTTHYSELSCLPYFSLVKQIVIDLMHNLFLGPFPLHLGSYHALTLSRPRQDTFLWYLGAAEDPLTQS